MISRYEGAHEGGRPLEKRAFPPSNYLLRASQNLLQRIFSRSSAKHLLRTLLRSMLSDDPLGVHPRHLSTLLRRESQLRFLSEGFHWGAGLVVVGIAVLGAPSLGQNPGNTQCWSTKNAKKLVRPKQRQFLPPPPNPF